MGETWILFIDGCVPSINRLLDSEKVLVTSSAALTVPLFTMKGSNILKFRSGLDLYIYVHEFKKV